MRGHVVDDGGRGLLIGRVVHEIEHEARTPVALEPLHRAPERRAHGADLERHLHDALGLAIRREAGDRLADRRRRAPRRLLEHSAVMCGIRIASVHSSGFA